MASATDPNTGCALPSKSTVLPALRAFTPPTMFVPDASIRRVCFEPSEPVMPCTMTRDFSVRKIAIGSQTPVFALFRAANANSAALAAPASIVCAWITNG